MGMIPVFGVAECPSVSDAHSPILAAFGQIIANKDEKHTQHKQGPETGIHFNAKGVGLSDDAKKQQYNRQ